MTILEDRFASAASLIPKKPIFYGFKEDRAVLDKAMTKTLSSVLGMNMAPYCSSEIQDEFLDYAFYVDDYGIIEDLGEAEYRRLSTLIPVPLDSYFEVTPWLLEKVYNINTWIYAQCRSHDENVVEIQIGAPESL